MTKTGIQMFGAGLLAAVVLLSATSGCRRKPPPPPEIPQSNTNGTLSLTASQMAGIWAGETKQGLPIEIHVTKVGDQAMVTQVMYNLTMDIRNAAVTKPQVVPEPAYVPVTNLVFEYRSAGYDSPLSGSNELGAVEYMGRFRIRGQYSSADELGGLVEGSVFTGEKFTGRSVLFMIHRKPQGS